MMMTVTDLIGYRLARDELVERVVATLPTSSAVHRGRYQIAGRRPVPLALVKGDVASADRARPRAHRVPDRRRVRTGACDCGPQFESAMR